MVCLMRPSQHRCFPSFSAALKPAGGHMKPAGDVWLDVPAAVLDNKKDEEPADAVLHHITTQTRHKTHPQGLLAYMLGYFIDTPV